MSSRTPQETAARPNLDVEALKADVAAKEAELAKLDLGRRFDLHRPDAEAAARCGIVRGAVKRAAEEVALAAPEGRERSLAITKLEEALYWAVAAIVRPAAG